MAFVGVETINLPETSLGDPEAVQTRFLQLMALDIPGFVIRKAGFYPFVHDRVERVASPVLNFGRLIRDIPFEVPKTNRDLTPHLDPHAVFGQHQMNEYSLLRGAVQVSIMRLQPDLAQKLADTGENYRYEYGYPPSEFKGMEVDDELVVPTAHRVELTPGDTLYFTDSRHVHYFRSLERPRNAYASLYYPSINDNVFADQSLRRVLELAAEGNPQAYIFPEVRNALRLAA